MRLCGTMWGLTRHGPWLSASQRGSGREAGWIGRGTAEARTFGRLARIPRGDTTRFAVRPLGEPGRHESGVGPARELRRRDAGGGRAGRAPVIGPGEARASLGEGGREGERFVGRPVGRFLVWRSARRPYGLAFLRVSEPSHGTPPRPLALGVVRGHPRVGPAAGVLHVHDGRPGFGQRLS